MSPLVLASEVGVAAVAVATVYGWRRYGAATMLAVIALVCVLAELVIRVVRGEFTDDTEALAFLAIVAFVSRIWVDDRAKGDLARSLPRQFVRPRR